MPTSFGSQRTSLRTLHQRETLPRLSNWLEHINNGSIRLVRLVIRTGSFFKTSVVIHAATLVVLRILHIWMRRSSMILKTESSRAFTHIWTMARFKDRHGRTRLLRHWLAGISKTCRIQCFQHLARKVGLTRSATV